jgi:methylenetetrahydrofolate dehydrogenase (NADP+) / methenyltetrahydrofolate cyclohydrolase
MKSGKLLKNSQSIKIFNGKAKAEKILLETKQIILKEKAKPRLAVVLIGQNKASKVYIRLKIKAANKVGIKLTVYKFETTVQLIKVIQKIEQLNNNCSVNGIIVQLPVSLKFKKENILEKINPQKDVDGFHSKTVFSSPLISAILISLKDSAIDLKKKKIIALVNSDVFGRKLKQFLKKHQISINYFLRKSISQKQLVKQTKKADLIITACGVPNLINNDMIKKNVGLIDAGITWLSAKKIVGDVNQAEVREKACFLTPVPGGLGPLTVALLLKNTYLSFKKYGKNS